LDLEFSIKVFKQYFNFACSHFLIFKDGTREPLHGHNYRIAIDGKAPRLVGDMVFDFLDIKPIVREICNELDHHLLLPKDNSLLKFEIQKDSIKILPPDGSIFIIPAQDVVFLPLANTSAERLAIYIGNEVSKRLLARFNFSFQSLTVEVEETPGQSAVITLTQEDASLVGIQPGNQDAFC